MKAVVLYSPNDFKTVEDYPKPTIGPNDMLLEMKRTAICGTDIRILEGKKTKSVRYGHVIGHEISGVICEVGENVQGYQVGDRVAVENVIPDGSCAMCVSGHDNICLNRKAIGYEFDGGFAEYVLLPQEAIEGGNVVKLSDDVSFGEGALIEPLSCCLRGQKNAGVKFNDVVVIIGAGPIGLMHIILAKAAGSKKNSFTLMNEEAEKAAPGCGGVVFLPYMQGERSPVWDPYARGIFFGVSLKSERKEFNRAVMESCGYGLRQLCEIAEKVTGEKLEKFASIGGGAKSDLWAQMKADITGKTIEILDMNDMAPVGAALLAGVGAGIFKNPVEASEKVEKKLYKKVTSSDKYQDVYEKNYQIYIRLYQQAKELYKINTNLK